MESTPRSRLKTVSMHQKQPPARVAIACDMGSSVLEIRSSRHREAHRSRGDPEAKERLFKCFQKALIKVAGKPKYDGPPFDERLSAAEVGFWKALAGFDLTRNNGFWAYARKFVEGAVADCVTDWHYRGLKDQSRAARKERAGHRPIIVEYNGVEGSNYDLEGREPLSESITGRIGADDNELRECDDSDGKVTDAAWAKIVAGRAVPTNWPGKGPLEPCKPIGRERYEEDQAEAHRFDTAASAQRRIADRFANIGRNLGVPRECFGVDENPRLNGGGRDAKSRFPIRNVFSETAATLKFKDGPRRTVVRQTSAGTVGNYTSVTGIPRFDGDNDGVRVPLYAKGPVLGDRFAKPALSSEYLAKYPTAKKDKINAPTRGNAPAQGIIGHLEKETNERALRRLNKVGHVQRAQELVAKDRYIAANRPLQRHLNADAVPKPTQLRPARKWRTENDLKQVRKTLAGAKVPDAEQALQSAIKWAEQASNNNSQLRIVKGVHDGQFSHPGTINNTLPSRDLHRHDGGDHRSIRKASGTSS
jgi:hypothetical protein